MTAPRTEWGRHLGFRCKEIHTYLVTRSISVHFNLFKYLLPLAVEKENGALQVGIKDLFHLLSQVQKDVVYILKQHTALFQVNIIILLVYLAP